MIFLLALFFLLTAVLYASVGFGGGSTYSALLVLSDADYRILPALALICNIIVVTGGVLAFARAGHLRARALLPFFITSIPAAWLGGRIIIPEMLFVGMLGLCLLAAGVHMMINHTDTEQHKTAAVNRVIGYGVGGAIGFLGGLVGIGGGIFLAPILYGLRWGTPRQIAAACSLFILVNSIAGLAGQVMKLGDLGLAASIMPYWPLFPAVLIGGQIGSRLATTRISASLIKRMTAILIFYVSARLLWRFVTMLLG